MDLPSEGTRLSLAGYRGTIKFVGKVDNTSGTWLGIEWDDPHRGRHDGVKDGKQYFTCRVRNAGSFIRPSAPIGYGTSFLDALLSKYIELPHGSASQEKVLLGSSHGAIEVEAVRLDKIRGKLSDLQRLSEVSLHNENVAKCDPPGVIRNTCPNVRGLDISMSLLPSWDMVTMITVELPVLQRLALNRCRLESPKDFPKMAAAFLCLTDLQLNGTLITWREMQHVTAAMPNLRLVEMGYNNLSHLSVSDYPPTNESTIQTINLDSNECRDWVHICGSLGPYNYLQRLILTSNWIETIPFPEDNQLPLKGLKHISLSFNRLHAWHDFDALSRWCPALETLTVSGNPIEDHELARYSQQFIISRIPTLVALNAATISPKERTDCELFYLSYIVNHGPKSEDHRRREHPQWQVLCNKHGKPDEAQKGKDHRDKLGNSLIALNIYRCFSPPPSDPHAIDLILETLDPTSLRVLPTMSLRTLRLKVCKSLKIIFDKVTVTLWLKMDDGTLAELDSAYDTQDLAWLGIDNSSEILIYIRENNN